MIPKHYRPKWVDKVTEHTPDPLVKMGEGRFMRLSEYKTYLPYLCWTKDRDVLEKQREFLNKK